MARLSSKHRRHHQARRNASRQRQDDLSGLPLLEVTIARLGDQGDGIAQANLSSTTDEVTVYVAGSYVGDRLMVAPLKQTRHGVEAVIKEVLTPSPDRKPAACRVASACGGCQFQTMKDAAYGAWKEQMVKGILSRASVNPEEWRPTFTANYCNRRRARFAFRRLQNQVICGFRGRQSHRITGLDGCVILHDDLLKGLAYLTEKMLVTLAAGAAGEAEVTRADNGLDVVLKFDKGAESLSPAEITALVSAASHSPITRLSMMNSSHGAEKTLLYQRDEPVITWQLPKDVGRDHLTVAITAGGFLQADPDAEMMMQADVFHALKDFPNVVDLFAGCGTLSLPLLMHPSPSQRLLAVDSNTEGLMALQAMAKAYGQHRVRTETRNLFKDPLTANELSGFDAAIIDPPRAGAAAQILTLATSGINRIVMVSCNPISFARDARVLIDHGYHCRWIRMVDQFLLTSHAELVAEFDKDN